jgi:predicted transcriptional regulator
LTVEHQSVLTKKESILKALLQVPIATTKQISSLFASNSQPLSKASYRLKELTDEKLVEWDWYKRQKIWRLTKKGLSMLNGTRMKYEHVDHTLAVGEVYFSLQPTHWMFEPIERFEYEGKGYTWAPDCIFVHNKKLYACEVQLTSLAAANWSKKWEIYNKYFAEAFKTGAFQEWANGKVVMPRFIAITTNKKAAEGFNIPQRELLVIKSIKEIFEK